MIPPLLAYPFIAALGLIVGSYLNVVIHRLPRGRSTVTPRSRCPYCDAGIRARDNVPIVSYLLLGGRCRQCGAPIAWRYPALEALTALVFIACLARFGPTPALVPALLFAALMIVLAGIDVEHLLLPDRITLPGIVAGLALQPLAPWSSFLDALLGALLGAGTLILLVNFWYWLRREEGMGLGDVNMLALIGAFLGWQNAAVALVAASLAGALVGLGLVVARRVGMKSRLPFGLFLAVGGLVALFFGARLTAFYGHLL